jgi:hypothetical protein
LRFSEISQVVMQRQREQEPGQRGMIDVRNRYNGDWVVPLPDSKGQPVLPQVMPALIGEAVDDTSRRFCSVMGVITCPALDPTKQDGVRSMEYAMVRRKIIAATYHRSKFLLARQRYSRHLAAYGTCSLMVWPDEEGYPCVEVRDPLTTYADPRAPEDPRPPLDCGFLYEMSAGNIRHKWPQARGENGGPIGEREMQELWYVVEWLDATHIVVGIVGPKYMDGSRSWDTRAVQTPELELSRAPNPLGYCPVIAPRKVSLDRLASVVANMVGSTDLAAKLMALDIVAQEKAVFTDRYVIGAPDRIPQIVGGEWHDGRTGKTNLLQNIQTIGELRATPDVRTQAMIDRLERNFRVSTGLVPQAGGETYGALRTGRGIDALMGAAVDGRIKELHELDQAFLPELNKMIFDTYSKRWPSRKYHMYSGWPGDKGHVDFTPATHIESTENSVDYVIAGADITQTTLGLTQLLAVRAISLTTFRRKHPQVPDDEAERRLVEEEELERAMKDGLLAKLSSGEMPAVYGAFIRKYIRLGDEIDEAIVKADVQLREWQAQQPAPAMPGQMAPPALMPGLEGAPVAGGGVMPVDEMAPTVPAPTPSLVNQRQSLMALRAGMGRT